MSQPIDGSEMPTARIPRVPPAVVPPTAVPPAPSSAQLPADVSDRAAAGEAATTRIRSSEPRHAAPAPVFTLAPAPPEDATRTREMPAIPGMAPGPVHAPERARPALPEGPDEVARPTDGRWTRALTTAAGLLSSGLLLLGVALAVLKFVVPAVRDAGGINSSNGPDTATIIVALLVGAAGESTRLLRRRAVSSGVRAGVAGAVIVVVPAVLWWSWWS